MGRRLWAVSGLLALLWAAPAWAAVTFEVSDFDHTVAATNSRTYSFNNTAAGTNQALAILVSLEGNGAGGISIQSITYNAVALTKLARVASTTWAVAEIWYLAAPATGAHNAVITLAASATDQFTWGFIVASNVNQATPLRTAASSAATSGTSASDTVAGLGTGDLVIDVVSIDAGSHAATVGADQTQRWNQENGTANNTGAGSTQLASAGGVMSWTWTTSAPYAHMATAFIDVAAGGGPTTVPTLPLMGVQAIEQVEHGADLAWTGGIQ